MSFIRFLFYKIFLTGRKIGYKDHLYKVLKVEYGWNYGNTYVRLDRKRRSGTRNYTEVLLASCYRTKHINKWYSVKKYFKG